MKYTVNDFEILADHFEWLNSDQVLTNLVGGGIGIATEGKKGYSPTSASYTGKYDEGYELVRKANEIIHPEKTSKEIYKIVLRSMGTGY